MPAIFLTPASLSYLTQFILALAITLFLLNRLRSRRARSRCPEPVEGLRKHRPGVGAGGNPLVCLPIPGTLPAAQMGNAHPPDAQSGLPFVASGFHGLPLRFPFSGWKCFQPLSARRVQSAGGRALCAACIPASNAGSGPAPGPLVAQTVEARRQGRSRGAQLCAGVCRSVFCGHHQCFTQLRTSV